MARGSFLLQARLEIAWLEQRLAELAGKTRWRRWAIHSMQDDLAAITRQILETVLEESGGRPIEEALDEFLLDRSAAYARLRRFMRALTMEGSRICPSSPSRSASSGRSSPERAGHPP